MYSCSSFKVRIFYPIFYSFLAYPWPQLILALTWCSGHFRAHIDIGLVAFIFRTICMEIIVHLIAHHPLFIKKVFKGNASKCHAAAWHSKSYVLLSCSVLKCFCSIHFKIYISIFVCLHILGSLQMCGIKRAVVILAFSGERHS